MILTLSAAILLIFSGQAFAATASPTEPINQGANGYNVYPLLSSLVVNPGSTKNVTIYLQNISHSVEQVSSEVVNFVASSSDNGQPALLLNGGSTSHGLKQFVSIANPDFTLPIGKTQSVNVTISIPKTVESGGYYAAIRFAPQSLTNNKNVNLSGGVASLILVTVPGNLNEDLSISKLGAGDANGQTHELFTSNKNIYGVVSFYNSGNVQVQPFGNFVVKSGGKNVDEVNINKNSGYILADSGRYFTSKLSGIGSFGKYTIYGSFGYGTHGQLAYASATFYVVPSWLIWAVAVIALLIIAYVILYLGYLRNRKSRRSR